MKDGYLTIILQKWCRILSDTKAELAKNGVYSVRLSKIIVFLIQCIDNTEEFYWRKAGDDL